MQHDWEILEEARPYDGAGEFIRSLQELGHVAIITNQVSSVGRVVSLDWIEVYLPAPNSVLMVGDGFPSCEHRSAPLWPYLLRLCETVSGGGSVWRASLESPHTHERLGFASLEALFAFLQQQTGVVSDSDGDKGEMVERSERRGR